MSEGEINLIYSQIITQYHTVLSLLKSLIIRPENKQEAEGMLIPISLEEINGLCKAVDQLKTSINSFYELMGTSTINDSSRKEQIDKIGDIANFINKLELEKNIRSMEEKCL